eukprot:6453960-Alexandrium_andersonii.AAC.1
MTPRPKSRAGDPRPASLASGCRASSGGLGRRGTRSMEDVLARAQHDAARPCWPQSKTAES